MLITIRSLKERERERYKERKRDTLSNYTSERRREQAKERCRTMAKCGVSIREKDIGFARVKERERERGYLRSD